MRRSGEQSFAFEQGLAHQPEVVGFQIAQAAVDQLCRPGGCVRGEIVLFDQEDFQPTSGRIARKPGPIDAAADDQEIVETRSVRAGRNHPASGRQASKLRTSGRYCNALAAATG